MSPGTLVKENKYSVILVLSIDKYFKMSYMNLSVKDDLNVHQITFTSSYQLQWWLGNSEVL